MERENLGPAEQIINTLLTHAGHVIHHRPGIVTPNPRAPAGVDWCQATHRVDKDTGAKTVYRLTPVGRRTTRTKLGVMNGANEVRDEGGRVIAQYQTAGLFPAIAAWLYRQIADVWKLDNEFAARWASYAYTQDHRDLKVALAAFSLVQPRRGDPVRDEHNAVVLYDEDYRDVGEAMCLLTNKAHSLNPRMLLRVGELLRLPEVAQVNRELGFTRKVRQPALGRWPGAVAKWLRYREHNPKMLDGLVRSGFRTTVMQLARSVGYKPATPHFFEALRWAQKQAPDGRRTMAIGTAVRAAEDWVLLDEAEVCERIVRDRPNWKRIVGLLPKDVGVTRAVMAAAIEAGSLSDKDLVILTPTLEELGLLEVQDVRERWQAATQRAEDMRAANIAKNVRTQAARETLEKAADTALQAAVAEVTKDLRVYFMVDVSGSMTESLPAAKQYLTRLVQAFPPDRVHVSTFNTTGVQRRIPVGQDGKVSAAHVEVAFRGVSAGGGTDYGAGIRALLSHRPRDGEDVLFFFVGDSIGPDFADAVRRTGFDPKAFAFLHVGDRATREQIQRRHGVPWGECVECTAAALGIPCFEVNEETFQDVYAVPRVLSNLIASTPVGFTPTAQQTRAPRETLVDKIANCDLLRKPAWSM